MSFIHYFTPFQWLLLIQFAFIFGRLFYRLILRLKRKEPTGAIYVGLGFVSMVFIGYWYWCFT